MQDIHAKEFTNLSFYKTFSTKNLNWKYPTIVSSYFWDTFLLNALRKEKRKSWKILGQKKFVKMDGGKKKSVKNFGR